MTAQVLIEFKYQLKPGEFDLFLLVDLEDAGSADDQGKEQWEGGSQYLHEHGHVIENISEESERKNRNTARSPSATGNIQNQFTLILPGWNFLYLHFLASESSLVLREMKTM